MQYRVGKIKNYKNGAGKIITVDKEYLFLDTDIVSDEELIDNDIVMFSDENNKYNRAFFVKKIGKKPISMKNIDNN